MASARRAQQQPQAAQAPKPPATLVELERSLARAQYDAVKWRRRWSRLRTGLRALLELDAAETDANPQLDDVTNG
jgi:hypothetical protein